MKLTSGSAATPVALTLLALLLTAALGADLAVRLFLGFEYDEVHADAAMEPPGALSVPSRFRGYDGDAAAFDRLDEDRDGRLVCTGADDPVTCPELWAANRDSERLRRTWTQAASTLEARRNGVPAESLAARLAKAGLGPRLARLELDLDGDGRITRSETVQAAAFLCLDSLDVQRMDRNDDGVLDRTEFRGAPKPAIHLLGTDSLGRDRLVRLLYGLRVSLLVALCATLVSFLVGSLLGLTSGFMGGRFDRLFLRLVEIFQAIPFIFVVILISLFARDVLQARWPDAESQALAQAVVLFCALGAIQWFSLARYARGLGTSLRHADFVRSLEGMGFSTARIVVHHLLPNVLRPLMAFGVLLVPTLVLEEAFLSFLGFGVQPPYPSLGILLNDGAGLLSIAPVALLVPAGTLLALTWSLHTVGEWLSRRAAPGRGEVRT
jgi:oligopeptide transport system permease protein